MHLELVSLNSIEIPHAVHGHVLESVRDRWDVQQGRVTAVDGDVRYVSRHAQAVRIKAAAWGCAVQCRRASEAGCVDSRLRDVIVNQVERTKTSCCGNIAAVWCRRVVVTMLHGDT